MRKFEEEIFFSSEECVLKCQSLHKRLDEAFNILINLQQLDYFNSEEQARDLKEKRVKSEKELLDIGIDIISALGLSEKLKNVSSLDQEPPKPGQFDCWQRLINRYSFENVFKTGLVRKLDCSNISKLKQLMIERRQLGIERYQTVLQAFNGRKAINDLLAEQLDSLAYSEQVSIETPELTEEMLKWQRITINSIQKLIEFKSKQEKKEI